MNLKEKINKWKNAQNPAKVTLYRIFKVVRAYWRILIGKQHIVEQVEWRLTQVKPECKANEACVICGCSIPELLYENDSCEGNCYPSLMEKKVWNNYKKVNFIKV